MAINQDIATEQYQIACDALMDIAQDYETSDETSGIALDAANCLTLQYIDKTIKDINKLNKQYATFISYMESIIGDLENTFIDDALIVPLQKGLSKAKKASVPAPIRKK
jgi:hypothetical protein